MHLTTYCCCIRSKIWTTWSLWAGEGQTLSAARDCRSKVPREQIHSKISSENVERAGLLALYVE